MTIASHSGNTLSRDLVHFPLNITKQQLFSINCNKCVCLSGALLGTEGAKEGSASVCWSTTGTISQMDKCFLNQRIYHRKEQPDGWNKQDFKLLHRRKDNQSSKVLWGCSNLSLVLQVFVECAGKTLRSSVIQKYKSNPNFPVLVDSIELVRS